MQKSWLRIGIPLALFLQSCSHTPQTQPHRDGRFEVIPIVGKFSARRAVLENGLSLVVLEDKSSPTFAYQTWFKIGSRNEVMGKTGLAHFFEHMMFKGTKTRAEGEFLALLQAAGAEGENAFTSTDRTVYVQELPKEHLDLIIDLESDRMVNLVVNDASFKTEREVVQNERRFRKENSPEGTLYETVFETAFQESPYHWPVIGYEQDLNLMSAQDARNFYEQYYSPERATVIVVGDVDADQVLKKVEKAYGSISSRNIADGEIKVDTPQSAQRRKKLELNLQNEKLWMVYKIPNSESPDTAAFEIIQAVLSDGLSSRLMRALVDGGIATNVSTGSFGLRDEGLFTVMVDLQKGKSAILAEQIVLRELNRLKTAPIREEELTRAKNLQRFHYLSGFFTSVGMAHFIGNNETLPRKLEGGLKVQQEIQQITPDKIVAAANQYFHSSKLTVITGVPKGKE